MLGFDAPLTIEIEDILDCPKALGARLTRHTISPIVITMLRDSDRFVHIRVFSHVYNLGILVR